MREEDVERALRNVRAADEARKANTARMDGCPLELFLQNHIPDARFVCGGWSDSVHRLRHWKKSEELYLAEIYCVLPVNDIADHFGRSVKAIKRKAENMGLNKVDSKTSRNVIWGINENASDQLPHGP